MKIIKTLVLILTAIIFIACNTNGDKKSRETNINTKDLVENIKNVEIQIQGMTCEIGCARLIQSKLYKADGVKFAKVSFKDSLGQVSYDANKISEDQLKEVVQNAGGGDLYKVLEIKEVPELKNAQ